MPISIPVFCYHNVSRIDGHTPERFESHLKTIKSAGFHTISSRELVEGMRGRAPLPKKACVLTFDDCHLSNWTVAAPLLKKHGMTATFFCVTDFIHQGDKRPQLAPEAGGPELLSARESFRRVLRDGDRSQFMNLAELRAMVQDFGFEVHAHSSRHQGCFRSLVQGAFLGGDDAHWSAWGIYPEELRQGPEAARLPVLETGSGYVYGGFWPVAGGAEAGGGVYYRRRTEEERRAFCLEDFRRCMEKIREVNGLGDEQYFCWPWGQFDELAESCLREAGFKAAFTLERGPNSPGGDVLRINRLGVGKKKGALWMRTRLAMYSGSLVASLFPKRLRKKPELKSVVYMTDAQNLSGGSRQMVNNIIGMRESGLRVTAVLPPGSQIREALDPMAEGENPVRVVEFGGFGKYVRAASFVADLARKTEADVVHTFHAKAYKSAAIAKFLGGRFLLFINRGVIFPPNTIFALYALASRGVTCNSRVCAEVLRRYLVPAGRRHLVYNSFLPEGGVWPPQRQAVKKRGARVLYVGNLGPAKGFDVFLKLADELVRRGARDLEYVAVGVKKDEPWQEMASPAVLQRLNVVGKLPHAEVLAELTAADILVLPSRQESLPNVMLEAFACSLPVVCTRVGGMPELVQDGVNGFVRESGDTAGLAEAVAQLAGDPGLRLRMGRINRRLVAEGLGNAAKTLVLLRLYSGQNAWSDLHLEELARQAASAPSGEPREAPPCRRT